MSSNFMNDSIKYIPLVHRDHNTKTVKNIVTKLTNNRRSPVSMSLFQKTEIETNIPKSTTNLTYWMSCLHYSFFAFTHFMSKNANAKKASIVIAALTGFPTTIDACFCHIINVTTVF